MRQHLVVVGASRAGLFAIEGARRSGYRGPITLIGAEPELPYDRPPLSKEFLDPADREPAAPAYRSGDALRDALGVQVRTGTPATRLDPDARTVWLGDEPVTYTAAVIATGAAPRALPSSANLEGVITLRTLDDARRLRAALETGPRTVVIGAGLIGSEVASAARKRRLPVTVVEALPVPLTRAVGEQSGKVCARLHERHGTRLLTGVHVTAVQGVSRVERVWLSDGSTLDADLVVVGIGVEPATTWLADSGLRLEDGLVCDQTLGTGAPGVYAAGDVMRWHNPHLGRPVRLETWTSAAEQGRLAACNALDPSTAQPYATVPYTWSDQYGSRLQFVGTADADEIVTIKDDVDEDGGYLALYRSDDRLTGAFGLDQTRLVPKLRAMIRRGVTFAEGVDRCAS
jgi:NADPH-dependent 2,4-dienoyl-CoA reductase/sulfur reductase-like enzyme